MRGISEERLKELKDNDCYSGIEQSVIYELLSDECKELNQWLPIDENTPKDRRLLLFFPGYGSYDGGFLMIRRDGKDVFAASASLSVPLGIWPTHYQELPEDPKE